MTPAETTAPEQRPIAVIDGVVRGRPFLPGESGNPAGRPKGSLSIRDSIRQYLEDNPAELIKVFKHFIEKNPEFMWSMMESAPAKGIAIGNPDGTALGEPSKAMLELAQKLNAIHTTASIGGDGAAAGALGN